MLHASGHARQEACRVAATSASTTTTAAALAACAPVVVTASLSSFAALATLATTLGGAIADVVRALAVPASDPPRLPRIAPS